MVCFAGQYEIQTSLRNPQMSRKKHSGYMYDGCTQNIDCLITCLLKNRLPAMYCSWCMEIYSQAIIDTDVDLNIDLKLPGPGCLLIKLAAIQSIYSDE